MVASGTKVSLEDFNAMKDSMETQMREMRKLLTKLTTAQGTAALSPPPSPEDKEDKENKGDKGVDGTKSESPVKPTNNGGKPEYHAVPFPYSPDLPTCRYRSTH